MQVIAEQNVKLLLGMFNCESCTKRGNKWAQRLRSFQFDSEMRWNDTFFSITPHMNFEPLVKCYENDIITTDEMWYRFNIIWSLTTFKLLKLDTFISKELLSSLISVGLMSQKVLKVSLFIFVKPLVWMSTKMGVFCFELYQVIHLLYNI